jgi:RES domain-containing protein
MRERRKRSAPQSGRLLSSQGADLIAGRWNRKGHVSADEFSTG